MHISISKKKLSKIGLLRKSCIFFAISMFFALIAFGNVLRFITLEGHGDNLLVTELFLYGFSAICFFFFRFNKLNFFFLLISSLLIFFSFAQGALFLGFQKQAFLHAVRLVFLMQTCLVLSKVFYEKFKGDFFDFLSWMLNAYVVAAAISLGIFILFRESALLWLFLKKFNISFNGDPHVKRLVSVYLDPNFYGAIAVLPFLISLILYREMKKNIYLAYAVLFALTIALTTSRSGICLFILTAFSYFLLSTNLATIRVRTLLGGSIVIALAGCFFLSNESFLVFLDRMYKIGNDPSALYRLGSFKNGLDVICENPLLGMGYNYLQKDPFIDSSILFFAGCFGVPICLAALAIFLLYIKIVYTKINSHLNPNFRRFGKVFLVYVLGSIFFYSFFNNLLFYPFWLIPVATTMLFLSRSASLEKS